MHSQNLSNLTVHFDGGQNPYWTAVRQRIDRNLDNSPRVVGLMRSLKFSIYHRRTSEVARVRMPVGMFTQPMSNILTLECPRSSRHKKCQKISGTCFLNDTATKLGAAMPSSSQIVYDVRGETPPFIEHSAPSPSPKIDCKLFV